MHNQPNSLASSPGLPLYPPYYNVEKIMRGKFMREAEEGLPGKTYHATDVKGSDVRPFFKFLIWNKSWFASSAGTF